MGKAAKSKRDEKPAEKGEGGDYEFNLPAFDEQAFMRREVQNAKSSFYTIALGLGAGLVAVLLYALPVPWYAGWLPIVGAMVGLRPMLTKLGFPEDVTAWKALFGSFFMLFFTALAVWILGVNVL